MDKLAQQLAEGRSYRKLTLILSESQRQKCAHLAKAEGLYGGITVIGRGTVKSTVLNILGIRSQKKELVNLLVEKERAGQVLELFANELRLKEPNGGVAYMTAVDCGFCGSGNTQYAEEELSMYKKLTVVVDRGMAEDVMDIACAEGVSGGTVIHGRGTGAEFTGRLLGMEVEPEKELVMILLPEKLLEPVAARLRKELELDRPGKGILFVEPVLEVRGISAADNHE